MNKKQALQVAMVVLVAGLAIAPAHAQAGTRIKVPFSFTVSGKTLPAGQYVVTLATETVRIRDGGGQTVAVTDTDAISGRIPDRDGRVVFDCYHDQCFLSQVWTAGRDVGRVLPKSKLETHLEQKVAREQVALLGSKAVR